MSENKDVLGMLLLLFVMITGGFVLTRCETQKKDESFKACIKNEKYVEKCEKILE